MRRYSKEDHRVFTCTILQAMRSIVRMLRFCGFFLNPVNFYELQMCHVPYQDVATKKTKQKSFKISSSCLNFLLHFLAHLLKADSAQR